MEKTYYLYRHIRLDKDQPFYIGIGVKDTRPYNNPSDETLYSRAFSKINRNVIWSRISGKTKFTVEILIESNDRDSIKQKEIEFIKLYGRINLKTGTLANMTSGGDGCFDLSEDGRNRLIKASRSREGYWKGKKRSQETIRKIIETRKNRTYVPSQKQKEIASKMWKGRILSPEHLSKLKSSVSKSVIISNGISEQPFISVSDCARFFLSTKNPSHNDIQNMTYRIRKAIETGEDFRGYKILLKNS